MEDETKAKDPAMTGPGIGRTRLYGIILAFTVLGYGWIGCVLSGLADGYAGGGALATPCLFKLATGLPCPSCGTTRAVEALMAGDPGGSLATNPFGLIVALGAIIVPPWVLVDLLRSRDSFHRAYRSIERTLTLRPPLAVSCILAVLANWGWNFLKGF